MRNVLPRLCQSTSSQPLSAFFFYSTSSAAPRLWTFISARGLQPLLDIRYIPRGDVSHLHRAFQSWSSSGLGIISRGFLRALDLVRALPGGARRLPTDRTGSAVSGQGALLLHGPPKTPFLLGRALRRFSAAFQPLFGRFPATSRPFSSLRGARARAARLSRPPRGGGEGGAARAVRCHANTARRDRPHYSSRQPPRCDSAGATAARAGME